MGPSRSTQVIRTAILITGTVTLTTATGGTTTVSRGRFTALSTSTFSVVVISIISTFIVISRPRLTAADSGQVGLEGGQVALAGGQVGLAAGQAGLAGGQVGLAGGQGASLAISAPSIILVSAVLAVVLFPSQATE